MGKFLCPICGTGTNSFGQPFVSEWAVATHVAGKIKHAKRDKHRSWFRKRAPEVNWWPLSVPELAQQYLDIVHQDKEAPRPPATKPTPLALVHEIEVALHWHVKRRLQAHFGVNEEEWWVQGVPAQIRKQCQNLREDDIARDEPYAYTYLIDHKAIIEKNWPLFEHDLARIGNKDLSRKTFFEHLLQLNDVRNRYAHPARAPQPGSQKFDDDLAFAKRIREIIDRFCTSEG